MLSVQRPILVWWLRARRQDVHYSRSGRRGSREGGTDKTGKKLDLTVRVTDVCQKIRGHWLVIHEHVSVPVDLDTDKPDLTSKP